MPEIVHMARTMFVLNTLFPLLFSVFLGTLTHSEISRFP
jgi:hypothetical protein